jgi:hypothetical protein
VNPDRAILVAWALSMGLITYREISTPPADTTLPGIVPGMPRPWVFVGASIAFAIAALVGEINGPLGAALALAWIVAIFLGYFGAPSRSEGVRAI